MWRGTYPSAPPELLMVEWPPPVAVGSLGWGLARMGPECGVEVRVGVASMSQIIYDFGYDLERQRSFSCATCGNPVRRPALGAGEDYRGTPQL